MTDHRPDCRVHDAPDGECTRWVCDCGARIAELEALLQEIDAKVIFETAVMDGTGNDLQERIEIVLGIGVARTSPGPTEPTPSPDQT